MKYIRTKDGAIYEVVDNEYIMLGKNKLHIGEISRFFLRTADTIEELCDIFVIWIKDFGLKNPIQFNNPIQTNNYINLKINKGHIGDVYGAIWTNRGLIYVAKMNENGELELL